MEISFLKNKNEDWFKVYWETRDTWDIKHDLTYKQAKKLYESKCNDKYVSYAELIYTDWESLEDDGASVLERCKKTPYKFKYIPKGNFIPVEWMK